MNVFEVWLFSYISQYDLGTKTGGVFTEYVNTFLKVVVVMLGFYVPPTV